MLSKEAPRSYQRRVNLTFNVLMGVTSIGCRINAPTAVAPACESDFVYALLRKANCPLA